MPCRTLHRESRGFGIGDQMSSNGDIHVESDPKKASVDILSFGSSKRAMSQRARRLIASFATMAIVLGGGVVAVTYYYDSVGEVLPDKIATAQATVILAGDGRTQIARLATVNRIDIAITDLPEPIRQALIAGEDKDFFKDSAVGSALTRRFVATATDSSPSALRTTVLARKLESRYSKLQILGFYLNSADFGRGAVGAETAAQAYFGKPARELTVAEAAVLGAVIKEPHGADGGLSAYDPEAHPDTAQMRWAYVLDVMVEQKWITSDERGRLQFPSVRTSSAVTTGAQWGITVKEGDSQLAAGNIVNYVYAEMKAQGIEPAELKTGGYRITTTIDPQAQSLLERAARPDLPGSQLYGRKIVRTAQGTPQQDLEAAGVVIDHKTGRVLAYYGGIDGTATDLAGVNTSGAGEFGGYSPGASMEIYTLAAALDAGASLRSRWKALPFTTDDRYKIGNGGAANTSCKDHCTLEYSLAKSYNVPFYWVARQVGPGAVVKIANAAGVQHMWDNNGHQMMAAGVQGTADRAPFDRQVGFGQYPITVFDHAAGVSTFANGGVANRPHFVLKVEKLDPVTGEYRQVVGKGERLAPTQVIRAPVAQDVTYAMKQTAADRGWSSAFNGREVAAVPGVWNASAVKNGTVQPSSDNAYAWVVGFTEQFSVAIWTGNAAGVSAVVDPVTKRTITPGTTAYRIWSGFVAGYSEAKQFPKVELAGPAHVGNDAFPLANGVQP